MLYLMEPVDNFFFRSSMPFEAGGETAAIGGMFPPIPSVYAGAFRTLLENSSKNGELGSADLGRGHQLRVSLNGLWINNKCYFPMPLDLYRYEEGHRKEYGLKWMLLKKGVLSNYPLEYMPYIDNAAVKKDKEQRNLYLSENNLGAYLNMDSQEIRGTDINEDYLIRETKLGIEVDRESGTSKNQRLYQVNYMRPCNGLKLVAEVSGIQVEGERTIKLGGEGKLARITAVDHQVDVNVNPVNSNYFKLYFATPAIFKNGWLPRWINKDDKTGYFNHKKKKIKVELISACVGRSVPCGGFGYSPEDKRYQPRELRYAVPAGSVYYFKILQGTFEDALRIFHKKNISDYRENMGFDYQIFDRSRYCDRGFGYTFVGKLSEKQEEMINV